MSRDGEHGGFTYTTCAAWDQERIGLGSWYRLQHELLLIATRGGMPPPAPANRPASLIRSPRGVHSAKPPEVREQVERMFPRVPKVELFAREKAPRWAVWGFEAGAADGRGDRRGRRTSRAG